MNTASYGETHGHFRVPRGSFFEIWMPRGLFFFVFWCLEESFWHFGRVLIGVRAEEGYLYEREKIASRRGHRHIPEIKCLW